MNPEGKDTFIAEDDMGEGYDFPYAEGELDDELEILQRITEKFRRIKENKTIR